MLHVGTTVLRAVPACLLAGLLAFAVLRYGPLSLLPRTLLGMVVGGLVSVPLIWPEIRLLFRL